MTDKLDITTVPCLLLFSVTVKKHLEIMHFSVYSLQNFIELVMFDILCTCPKFQGVPLIRL